ncbi:AMP-binding protein [Streptomyces sp. NPDC001793]|uniref:AMP-binding protein n=1 Tax=Streptomyces sp. NPDC001793 TaxID=3154657 RepID=UPI003316D4AA
MHCDCRREIEARAKARKPSNASRATGKTPTPRYAPAHGSWGPFTAQARRAPTEAAVTDGRRSLTYAELDAESSALACVLVEAGVAVGDRVGVCVCRGVPR